MSYHGLGLELPGTQLPGIPGVSAPAPTPTWTTDAEKVAARDAAREEASRVDELKRRVMAEEEQSRRDVSLPGQEYVEDWTPVPEAEVEAAPEQKVPWLALGLGGIAVIGMGYFIWRK